MTPPDPVLVAWQGLGDARLLAIEWRGLDVLLRFALPSMGGVTQRRSFLLVEAREVAFALNFGLLVGEPLVWEATMKRAESGLVETLVDFAGAPAGEIRCTCARVELLAER